MRALFTFLILGLSHSAQAYSLALPGQTGCHEEITSVALRNARAQFATAPALQPTRDQQALIDDIPWRADDDMRDFAAISLLLGVRDNDLKGHSLADSFDVVQINGDPTLQNEHCLRTPDEDEPNGTVHAIADCHQFIHDRVAQALDALDGNGVVDPTLTTLLPIDLALRGSTTDALLPIFYVRMGMALHALEDGFSHNLRTSDGMMITSAFNWVEYAEDSLVEKRDGPPHSFDLDNCNATDTLRMQRRTLATSAATELLSGVLNPALTRADKLAIVDDLFTRYFLIAPGCDINNAYCDPQENVLRSNFACSFSDHPSMPLIPIFIIGGVFVGRRLHARRKRRRAERDTLLIAAFLLVGATAHAQMSPPPPAPPPLGPRVGVYVGFGASIDRPAMAATVGGRLRLSRFVSLGLDAEFNPWITESVQVRLGSFNLAGRLIVNYPIGWRRARLHTSASLGTSVQLLDLYGAERGSVGIFGGGVPLGIDVLVGRGWRVVIDPIGIYVPAPHLRGVPLWYLQYRITVGIQFGG